MRNVKLVLCMKFFFISIYALSFFSCASSRFESKFSPVYVTNSAKFALLPPESMAGVVDKEQKLSARFGKFEFETDIYTLADSEQLSMIIMSEFGTTMASFFYDGESLDFDTGVFPKEFKAEYIIADFQFGMYDEAPVKAELAKIGIDFEVNQYCEADRTCYEIRTLSQKGKVIEKITKSEEAIHYENFLRGYSYTLTGVES